MSRISVTTSEIIVIDNCKSIFNLGIAPLLNEERYETATVVLVQDVPALMSVGRLMIKYCNKLELTYQMHRDDDFMEPDNTKYVITFENGEKLTIITHNYRRTTTISADIILSTVGRSLLTFIDPILASSMARRMSSTLMSSFKGLT